MSLPAMTFGDRFCFSRKGEIGGGGWVHPKGTHSMAVSVLRFRNTLVGSVWVTAVLLCTNGLRNSPLALHGTHFQQGSLYPSLGKQLPAECLDYCKLVNGRV